ncbi:MAG: Ig-like domain-containing protein [Steroidobacteraceae bacterium]
MSPVRHTMIVALLAAAITGCAGNGAGLDANGNPISAGGGGTTPLTADFQSIQDNVFTPICTKCHIGAGAPEGLQLDAAHSYALLVGVPSTEQPNVLRVNAGNPGTSYIVLKLQGSPGITGDRMPFGGPYLPQSTIDVIRQWISDGAMQSMAANVTAAAKAVRHFSVVSASPDQDSVATMALPRIVVAFSGDLDPSLVNNTTVSLQKTGAMHPSTAMEGPMESAGAMGSMDPAVPAAQVSISTAIPAGDPSALMITPRVPLGSGTYRVTLRASLADMSAQALGSDYSLTFTVDTSP